MPRTLTIAALLPALGAATAAWAQHGPPPTSSGDAPAPQARQLSWPGRAATPTASQPAWPSAPTDSFAPPQPVMAQSPTYAARPPIIPHGGYPWRSAPAHGEPQPAPAPELRPVTSHPDAVWRPYVSAPAETPAPDFTPPVPYQAAYQPPPWTRQPTQSQPQPYAPQAAPQASPAPFERAPEPSQPAAQPQPAPVVQHMPSPPPPSAPMPEPMHEPMPEPVRQAQPAAIAEPQPAPPPPPPQPEPATTPTEPAVDPLAPRRDALIFQLQRNTPQPPAASAPAAPETPTPQQPPQAAPQPARGDAPTQSGARYYSVHRQAGRQPDATPLPAPNYLDALPVELDQPIASDDLAQPPEAPAVMRDAQGRLRAAPLTDGPDLP
ncbi:hypothetical protein [Brevundimonas guildfordensis]|uniref:Uncharacterized protein n=1 Tax=Brevundimonas guildfordensis TaxID=2762241 RepID=A0ABR8R2Y5_9CAUL|nr:hypothetical protein [Brevundimonas guildfordensis]MBD7941827.1 hypothetical protein [Brevundimonas guildfordensis]